MHLPLYLARHIYKNDGDKHKVSRPAVHIATAGVAIGLAVMIVTVAVVLGFKHTIRDKVVGFGSHIQVENFMTLQQSDAYPVCIGDSMMRMLKGIDGIKHVERFANTQGILKTDADFLGIIFKGVGQEYDMTFLRDNLTNGDIPHFSDSTSSNKILISRMTANRLQLRTGDHLYAYFIGEDNVRARKFCVAGIYESNMSQFDKAFCYTDIYTTRKLNEWSNDMCNGAELIVGDFGRIEQTAQNVIEKVNRTQDRLGQTFMSQTIYEAYPNIFSWLELLDMNVWIILALMACVAGVTMISGLLIIILERTQMIGTLKALGADNTTIRHTFLWFAVFVIGKGLIIGNVIGIGLVILQQATGIVTLDPQTYYVSKAPTELNIPLTLMLNIATLLVCITVLIAPSYVVSHIKPAKSIRFE